MARAYRLRREREGENGMHARALFSIDGCSVYSLFELEKSQRFKEEGLVLASRQGGGQYGSISLKSKNGFFRQFDRIKMIFGFSVTGRAMAEFTVKVQRSAARAVLGKLFIMN